MTWSVEYYYVPYFCCCLIITDRCSLRNFKVVVDRIRLIAKKGREKPFILLKLYKSNVLYMTCLIAPLLGEFEVILKYYELFSDILAAVLIRFL